MYIVPTQYMHAHKYIYGGTIPEVIRPCWAAYTGYGRTSAETAAGSNNSIKTRELTN